MALDKLYLHIPDKKQMLLEHPKYRLKLERKKVLKISVMKIKNIDDPEAILRRAVLINNTLKAIQSSMREKKEITVEDNYRNTIYGITEDMCSYRKSFKNKIDFLSEIDLVPVSNIVNRQNNDNKNYLSYSLWH